MFCPECGKKIENESIYCPYCGTKIPSPAQPPLRYGNATEEVRATSASEPEKVNLKTALRSSRQHPRKLLTQIVIAALALALATSTAYAAYYVYTNVYLPSQQTQQQDSKANEAPTYTIETKTVDVSVPSDPFISPGKRTSDTWSYPQIVSSAPSNVIDDINRCIQEQMEETAEQTNAAPDTWDELQNGAESGLEEYGLCTLTRGMAVTYMDDTYMCIRDAGYATLWGPHGNHFAEGQTYNLQTGDQVDPWTVFGMDEEETVSATKRAVKMYLASNPSDLYTVSEVVESINSRIVDSGAGSSLDQSNSSQASSPFVITNEGLVYMTSDYELGSYAFGTRNILVKGFNDDSKVGTTIELTNPQVANG